MSPWHWLRMIAALGVIVAALAGWPAAARDLRAADTQPEHYPTVRALAYMDRLVRERTGGRHRILVFHSRQLGEEQETIEQTRAGAIDLNRINVAPLGAFIPEANVLAMPFLFRDEQHLYAVLEGPIGEDILASFADHGLVGLAFYDSGMRSIYNRVRPIHRVEDLKGLRIRVQQSDLMIDMVRALGAEPVALAYGQIATALSAGLIDGAENNWPSYVTTGHYSLAPYYTLTRHTMSPEVLVMSQKAWDGLSEEDRRIFREAARESAVYMRELWKASEAEAVLEARNAGVTIIDTIDRGSFAAAVQPLYDRWLTDARMRDLVERIRSVR
jgi:tripartite ATP-independent transporter DctP family solute receptor